MQNKILLGLVLAVGAACANVDWTQPGTRPPVPLPPVLAHNTSRAEIGRKLFNDPRLTGLQKSKTLTCGACHWLGGGGTDMKIHHGVRTRPVYNAAFATVYFHDGSTSNLHAAVAKMIEDRHFSDGGPLAGVAARLAADPDIAARFRREYGEDGLTGTNVVDALVEYLKTLVTADAQERVPPAVVTYEAFGAVGDGKADDQAAIVAAHAAANEKGLPVKAGDGKTYYIGGGAAVAVIKTDVDFGTAKFVIDDRKLKNHRAPIFRIVSDARPFAVKGVKTLARGQAKLDVSLPCDCLLIAVNNKVRRYIRYGRNQNNGVAQREVFLAGRDGTVDPRAPIVWDFETVTSLSAHPIDARTLVVKGGAFTTIANQAESKYNYHARNFSVERSNVRLEGVKHFVTGELDHGAPYGGFFSIQNCANVTVTNCLFTAHKTYSTIGAAGLPVSMGSYDLSVGTAVNVSFIGCRQTTDINDHRYWGLLGSNYCKNLLYDDCEFSRFDAHMGVANATIRNSKLGYMGINAIGFGTFLVENSTVCCANFFNLRGDYGSTWEGEFIVRNCTFLPANGRPVTGQLVNGSYSGKHDFGYVCHMPRRIVFDGLKIDDSHHSEKKYEGPWIFGMFNAQNKGPDYVEDYPYHVTEEVVLKNVTTASGKPVNLSPNPWMFRNVKVER